MTVDEYTSILASQGGTCAICHLPPSGIRDNRSLHLAVDHDHAIGPNAVRGLLCQHCNVGLGGFKDNPALLLAAIAYLKSFEHDPESVDTPAS